MDTLYMSGLMQIFLVAVYVPLVLLGLRWVWRRILPSGWGWKISGTAVYLALATLLALGDVFYTHWQMARLCPEAGLHVYRSVEVDGFYSELALPKDVMNTGYDYVEFDDVTRLVRYKRTESGIARQEKQKTSPQHQPESRYWLTEMDEVMSSTISKTEYAVVDSHTGEVLGRSVSYRAHPGWLDRWLLQMFDPLTWPCGKADLDDAALQERVLLPAQENNRKPQ